MELQYYSESGYELGYAYDGDAGLDLPIHDEGFGEEIEIKPRESVMLKTGVYVAIPEGNYGLLDTRSSTSKLKLDLLCRTIDRNYRGNIRLSLINNGDETVVLKQGQCVAQIIIQPYTEVSISGVSSPDDLGDTSRGSKGFGSSGGNVKVEEF